MSGLFMNTDEVKAQMFLLYFKVLKRMSRNMMCLTPEDVFFYMKKL